MPRYDHARAHHLDRKIESAQPKRPHPISYDPSEFRYAIIYRGAWRRRHEETSLQRVLARSTSRHQPTHKIGLNSAVRVNKYDKIRRIGTDVLQAPIQGVA